MKNAAILALILGILGSAANAESAVTEAPNMTLAFNSTATTRWIEPSAVINTEALDKSIERKMDKAMENVAIALDKKLEDKIAQELEYVIH